MILVSSSSEGSYDSDEDPSDEEDTRRNMIPR